MMIELSKHIEILLLENDCVIVPELGGFIAHYQPAHYEEDEGIFLPPLRTVGFNPELTMNDGLLTQSYMHAYHTDFPDAVRKIAIQVEEMKEILYKEGVVELHGIGKLHYTIYNTYEFHPNEGGIISPSLYGLDAISIRPLSAIMEELPMEEKEEPKVLPMKEKKEYRLNPKWWSNAVAVAVAAILFFVLSVPVENTYVDKGNYASLGTDCLFEAIRSHSVATNLMVPASNEAEQQQTKREAHLRPVAVKVEKVAPAPVTAPVVKEEPKEAPKPVVKEEPKPVVKETPKPAVKETPKPAVKPAPQKQQAAAKSTKNYHIIVASLATSSDAQRMLKEYIAQGHLGASIIEGNGRFRISLSSSTNKSAAYQKLNELKKSKAFESAWMLTSK